MQYDIVPSMATKVETEARLNRNRIPYLGGITSVHRYDSSFESTDPVTVQYMGFRMRLGTLQEERTVKVDQKIKYLSAGTIIGEVHFGPFGDSYIPELRKHVFELGIAAADKVYQLFDDKSLSHILPSPDYRFGCTDERNADFAHRNYGYTTSLCDRDPYLYHMFGKTNDIRQRLEHLRSSLDKKPDIPAILEDAQRIKPDVQLPDGKVKIFRLYSNDVLFEK